MNRAFFLNELINKWRKSSYFFSDQSNSLNHHVACWNSDHLLLFLFEKIVKHLNLSKLGKKLQFCLVIKIFHNTFGKWNKHKKLPKSTSILHITSVFTTFCKIFRNISWKKGTISNRLFFSKFTFSLSKWILQKYFFSKSCQHC